MFRASWATSARFSLSPHTLASVSTTASTRLRSLTDPPLPARPTPASPASTRPVAASPVPVNPLVCPVCCITAPFPCQGSEIRGQFQIPHNSDLFPIHCSLFPIFRSSHSGPRLGNCPFLLHVACQSRTAGLSS